MPTISISLSPEMWDIIAKIEHGDRSATIERVLRDRFMTINGINDEIQHHKNTIIQLSIYKGKLKKQESFIKGCEQKEAQEAKEMEKKLNLTEKEVRHLQIATEPNTPLIRQRELFCASTKRQLTIDEFSKLKEKYGIHTY